MTFAARSNLGTERTAGAVGCPMRAQLGLHPAARQATTSHRHARHPAQMALTAQTYPAPPGRNRGAGLTLPHTTRAARRPICPQPPNLVCNPPKLHRKTARPNRVRRAAWYAPDPAAGRFGGDEHAARVSHAITIHGLHPVATADQRCHANGCWAPRYVRFPFFWKCSFRAIRIGSSTVVDH